MNKATLERKARKLHTHTVVFRPSSIEEKVAAMAHFGLTTEAISQETGLSMSQVQYRISKAQHEMDTRLRDDWRRGSPMAKRMMRQFMPEACANIQKKVAPAFLPLASNRLAQ